MIYEDIFPDVDGFLQNVSSDTWIKATSIFLKCPDVSPAMSSSKSLPYAGDNTKQNNKRHEALFQIIYEI